MNIGIAGPIEIASLIKYLPKLKSHELKLGLGGTAVNLLIEGLLKEGHQITVFTLDVNITDKYIIEGENLKIIFGHFRTSVKRKMLDFCRQEYLQIKKFIQEERENLDIVNAHWSYEFAIGTILAKVPHLITFRDDSPTILKLTKHPYRLARLLMDFWVRRKGNAFSYNSKYLQDLIKKEGVILPNPIKISTEVEPRSFPKEGDQFNIFFIANGWDYRKNPETAIEGFSIARKEQSQIHLHLIGTGFEKGGEGYHIVERDYDLERIHFRGFMKHEDLLSLLTNCDIMLHTSREESFGNNLIEAMARGIPVVAGEKSGAVPWVLDGGKAGVLVDIENAEDVAVAIQKLTSEKSDYEQMSSMGLQNVSNRFSLDIVTRKYLTEYQQQIEKQNK